MAAAAFVVIPRGEFGQAMINRDPDQPAVKKDAMADFHNDGAISVACQRAILDNLLSHKILPEAMLDLLGRHATFRLSGRKPLSNV